MPDENVTSSDPASVIQEALEDYGRFAVQPPHLWTAPPQLGRRAQAALAALELLQSRAAENTKGIAFGQGLPPAGGWKRHMVEDPTEYSPEFQDEYRRLWHEAASERDEALARVREVEAERNKANALYARNMKDEYGRRIAAEATVARQAETLGRLKEILDRGGPIGLNVRLREIAGVLARAVLASPEAASAASLPCTRCGATPDEGLNDDCPECQGVVGPEAAATEPHWSSGMGQALLRTTNDPAEPLGSLASDRAEIRRLRAELALAESERAAWEKHGQEETFARERAERERDELEFAVASTHKRAEDAEARLRAMPHPEDCVCWICAAERGEG